MDTGPLDHTQQIMVEIEEKNTQLLRMEAYESKQNYPLWVNLRNTPV